MSALQTSTEVPQGTPLCGLFSSITTEDGIWGPYTLFGKVTVSKDDLFACGSAGFAVACAARAFFTGLAFSHVASYAFLAAALVFAAREIRKLTIYGDIAKTSEDLKTRSREYEALNKQYTSLTEEHRLANGELLKVKGQFEVLWKQMIDVNQKLTGSAGAVQSAAQLGVEAVVAESGKIASKVSGVIEAFQRERGAEYQARLEELTKVHEKLTKAHTDHRKEQEDHRATLAKMQKDCAQAAADTRAAHKDLQKTQAEVTKNLALATKAQETMQQVLAKLNSAAGNVQSGTAAAQQREESIKANVAALTALIPQLQAAQQAFPPGDEIMPYDLTPVPNAPSHARGGSGFRTMPLVPASPGRGQSFTLTPTHGGSAGAPPKPLQAPGSITRLSSPASRQPEAAILFDPSIRA